jgi:hypothetical protein
MIGGLAGDMFLAAALDAGIVDPADIAAALSTLGVGDIEIQTEHVRRGAISGTHIEFTGWDPAQESDHRHLSTILEMLETSGLDDAVKARAAEMFELLGRSESKIHDIPMERVHFHEVGALDSIFDFVSAAYIIEHAADTWSFGDIPTGCGTIEVDHGTMPVPAPATADLLKGLKVAPTGVEAELVTPTGATILRTLDARGRLAQMPTGVVTHSGYGAGTRDMDTLANVVRMTVLDTAADADHALSDEVVQLCCDIDDMNPEQFAHVEDVLFERGALDVVRVQTLMKKGRQGVRLSVLCNPRDRQTIADALFTETTTFGIRIQRVERMKLRRELVEVETPGGPVRVKIGYLGGRPIKASPEYEDCARIAAATDTAIGEVYADATLAARNSLHGDDT